MRWCVKAAEGCAPGVVMRHATPGLHPPSPCRAWDAAGARPGGPSSVYDAGSPTVDPAIFGSKAAVLGICYGLQLTAHLLGGRVEKVDRGEYGRALLEVRADSPLLDGWAGNARQVWMSHRDTVLALPDGFRGLAITDTCPYAAIADEARRIYGVQFHPEVVHTHDGSRLLRNFLFDIAGCQPDWDPSQVVEQLEDEIRHVVGTRKVFFFISGGVDSTVAYTLSLRALGARRVRGIYVDTGLMRKGETQFVRDLFSTLGGGDSIHVAEAESHFLAKLDGVVDPETKRHRIGQEFLEEQNRILETEHFLDEEWILGQGTIYPDTIESGGTAKADLIKTHHNRVEGIQRLMAENRIVEPLHNLYKDEVRQVGAQLGIPPAFLHRHPFPGPGLAIRCLCAAEPGQVERMDGGWLLPLHSVGVQGDSRSYKPVLLMDLPTGWPHAGWEAAYTRATELINANDRFNRVVLEPVPGGISATDCAVRPATITRQRLHLLREADALVRQVCADSGFEDEVWQFPVVLAPFGVTEAPDSVVLRPIQSVDGMTAQSVGMPVALLQDLCARLRALPGIACVLYDLTHKPPGTIEWE